MKTVFIRLPTCTVRETLRRPCALLRLEEEKWTRRVEALETAIGIYIDKKTLIPRTNEVLIPGPRGKLDYNITDQYFKRLDR